MDPVSALIGSLLLGFGTMLLVGAIKNRKVLGKDGIISRALATGSIASLDEVAQAFPANAIGGAIKSVQRERGPETTRDAIDAIAVGDRSLANNIGAQLELIDDTTTSAELMPLRQLLAIADARGFTVSTAAIRAYVKEVTDVSI